MSLPSQMRAVLLTGHGGPEKLVYRTDVPVPQPGPGEVLIRVGACGLNNTDINTRTAWYSTPVRDQIAAGTETGFAEATGDEGSWGSAPVQFPRIQGADVAGRIVAVGPGVDPRRVGARVLVDPWLLSQGDWLDPARSGYFGSECDGGFAEYTKVRAENALTVDSPLSDAELATFPCAYSTAENLVARAAPHPGDWVAITGASGGVGSAAIQLCRLRGARVIAVASAAKSDALHSLGAERVIDRRSPDLEAALRAAAQGPVDIALDVVGGPLFMSLLNALRQGGRYSSAGCIGGPLAEFDLRRLIYKDLQLTGATICPPGTLRRVVKMIETGALVPLLAQSFPLARLAEAQAAFSAKTHIGNIVVTCEGPP